MGLLDNLLNLDKGIKRVMTSYRYADPVTPNDANDLPRPALALYIGTTGDVVVTTEDGTDVTFKTVPVGILPVVAVKVKATNTTAANIVALA